MKHECRTCAKYVFCRHAFGAYHEYRSHGGVGCDLLFDVPDTWLTREQYKRDAAAFEAERNPQPQSSTNKPKLTMADVARRLSILKQKGRQ